MKKKLLMRCLLGAPVGVTISLIITIVISYFFRDGAYHAVVPELAAACGSEINALTLQTVCSLLYGAAWAGASLIWEAESWSLLKMTVVHLVVCSAATFPVAYFMRWMHHSVTGFLLYFGVFLLIYAVIWLSMYGSLKKKLRAINEKLGG
jgi:hypothetical protein